MTVSEAAEAVRVARDNHVAALAVERCKENELAAAKSATRAAARAHEVARQNLVAVAETGDVAPPFSTRPAPPAGDFEPVAHTGPKIGVRLSVTTIPPTEH